MGMLERRRNISVWAAVAALAACVSCGGGLDAPLDGYDGVPGEKVSVEFVIGGAPTRAAGADPLEGAVDHWALYLFRASDGSREVCEVSSSSAPITKDVFNDVEYNIYAVANYPSSFLPASVTSESVLLGTASSLSDGGAYFVMFGSAPQTVLGSDQEKSIWVSRLACRLGVERVTVNMEDPYYASKPFVLKGIWASNVYIRSTLGADHPASTVLSSAAGAWLNRMGQPGSGADTGINRTIAQGGSYTTAHYFYTYPDTIPAASDSRSETWSPRCTRIVINASIGGTDYYYAVTVPAMERNNSYVIADATITRPGSLDPEVPSDGAIDVTFATDTDGWDGPVSVSEES